MAQSDSSHSSQPSSPSQSYHAQRGSDVPIETLIAYLVAAKRSLSSIHLVHRATNILSDARSNIESAAGSVARSKYLRHSLASQLKILRGIQFEIEGAVQAIKSEIQSVIGDLEKTDRQLAGNVELLKATSVEEGFRNKNGQQDNAEQKLTKDTLHDFVDDKPVEELKQAIQTAIDTIEAAESKMDDSIRDLEDDLQSINAALSTGQTVTSSSTSFALTTPNVAQTLHALEAHAHEMAVSLESLVKHFDLCVTAIKHTEGAGALVAKTVDASDLPEGGVSVFYDTPAQPLTIDERQEMLSVLANDAAEVDDVVMELSDRASEMELRLDALLAWRETNEKACNDVNRAFKLLEKVSARLPTHVAEVNSFTSVWHTSHAAILDGQSAMNDLSLIYSNFLTAYDSLLVEVARRRAVKKQMHKVIDEAHRRLEELYQHDVEEREAFKEDRGDYLPSDIWAGLGDLPARFEIARIEGEESVPELNRGRVEEALRRLKNATRT